VALEGRALFTSLKLGARSFWRFFLVLPIFSAKVLFFTLPARSDVLWNFDDGEKVDGFPLFLFCPFPLAAVWG